MGCAGSRGVETHVLEAPYSGIAMPSAAEIRESPLLAELAKPVDSVWDGAVHSLAPLCWIIRADPGNHILLFVEVDGLSDGTFAEFPMAALFEAREPGWTVVHVLPLESDHLGLRGDKMTDYGRRQMNRARAFLLRIEAELVPENRWPWLFGR